MSPLVSLRYRSARAQLTVHFARSRRFKVGGSEYKWKVAENDVDLIVSALRFHPLPPFTLLQCVSTRRKTVAAWSQEDVTLRVTDRGEGILDRVVVTCFLNLWMKRLNMW